MDVTLYHDSLDIFLNALVSHAVILDVGCGPGNISRYLLDRREGLYITGIDLAENMIALAKENNPEARFEVMDCRDILTTNKTFDGVVLGFCLPYLTKEETLKLISDAASMLLQGGMLYLSTMEDDYSKSGAATSSSGDDIYMYYHEEKYLSAAIVNAGLNIKDLRRKEYPGRDGNPVVDIIIVATK